MWNLQVDLIEYKYLCCNKNYQQKFDEKLKERFFNTYKFSNHDNNKFILLLWKGVYPYEYMDDWEKFNETSLPEKEDFYSHLNMKDIADADYAHAKRVCKDFEIKNLGEYYDLYVQSDRLLLVDVFENFRNMCLKIYELDLARFLSVPGWAWQETLKERKVKLDFLTDIDILLMVANGIRGGIYHSIYQYAKANKKYIKNYDKNKESSYLQYWDVSNLHELAMSQKLPLNNFERIEDTSQFKEDSIKIIMKKVMKDIFIRLMFNIEKLHEFHNDLAFLPERMKIEKVKKLVANSYDKTEYVIHIRNLKQALNYRLVLIKVNRVIKFNQNAWLKPYIGMKKYLRKKAKNDFEK